MSPISQSSVSTQILLPNRSKAAVFYSPVHPPSFMSRLTTIDTTIDATTDATTTKKNTNVRILSRLARRRNPHLVCEVDYLRALLGSPDAISNRFKGPTGKRVSWKRVLTALSLLTGHKRRNINGTRSRWGRTPDKKVSLEQAQGLLGDVLTHLDDTPDVEEGEEDDLKDDLKDDLNDSESVIEPVEQEDVFLDEEDAPASNPSTFDADLSIYPIDAVTAAQLVQSGAVKQAFAYPIEVAPRAAPIAAPIAPRTATSISVTTLDASKASAPRLFDWNDADCCLGLVNCPVTKMRCDYCGETVNSTTRSYHKRCKKDFSVY